MKSEKRTTVYFEASSADRLCELLGAYDENLKTLSAELGVEISVADGLTLKISGEKEIVVLCEKLYRNGKIGRIGRNRKTVRRRRGNHRHW